MHTIFVGELIFKFEKKVYENQQKNITITNQLFFTDQH